jgi:multiple sugar transport system permease protein
MTGKPLAIAAPQPPLISSEAAWGFFFLFPYIVVFTMFVAYPIGYAAWLATDTKAYAKVFDDPIYWRTAWNTFIFLLVGVNLKMILALFLSGFFALPYLWVRIVGMLFLLPWAVPHIPSIMSIRWMLNSEWGMLNVLLFDLFGIEGPNWLSNPTYGLGAILAVHVWKYLPFWTMILVAGRMAIPKDLYEAAKVDGATSVQRFRYVTFPQLKALFLTSTMLTTIWSLGDFNSVYLLTGGGPADRTNTLATMGIRYAFRQADFEAGIVTMVSAIPILIPLVILLTKRLSKAGGRQS